MKLSGFFLAQRIMTGERSGKLWKRFTFVLQQKMLVERQPFCGRVLVDR